VSSSVKKYSAQAIISLISKPKNGLKIEGGIPKCPKEKECLDSGGNCKPTFGCHQIINFFRENPYGYFNLNFTYPLHKKVNGDGYIKETNGSLLSLIRIGIITGDALIEV
jgi:hypothetical protein